MSVRILTGDCHEVLKGLPDESVHCVVTSPPYFGLRDYGVAGQLCESQCLMFVGGESRETGLICGRPREEGKPYCSNCARLAYLPPETQRRRAA